jgi:hypothetical protein
MKRTTFKAMSVLALILSMTLCLPGCAGLTFNSTSPLTTLEQMQAGAEYLDSTLATVAGAVAGAKIRYPEKIGRIEQDIEPVLTELRAATASFKAALAAQDVTTGASAWATARALVTSLISAATPYLIGALI